MGRELYVGNLPYDVNEDSLRKLFSVSGKVVSLRPIVDQVDGKFKGCAYVVMGSDAEAADAVESLDGALLNNRRITVSLSRTKAQRMQTNAPKQPAPVPRKPKRRP
ncbi:MAG TPA: RNA-binding protein [Verrucomicrobiae bacterium]|nr:RNA-binding protein [Verrucomicrobiae bacterium]